MEGMSNKIPLSCDKGIVVEIILSAPRYVKYVVWALIISWIRFLIAWVTYFRITDGFSFGVVSCVLVSYSAPYRLKLFL